jgi:endogenous inhibitor of DNA gyrase (YacG/DUF329 family)
MRKARRWIDVRDPLLSPPWREPHQGDPFYRTCPTCNRPVVPTEDALEACCSDLCARTYLERDARERESLNARARDLAARQRGDRERRAA